MSNKIKVVELFAGVGGFRLGLERASDRYEVVWSNQWEPSTKVQHASDIYVRNFGPENHHNSDISKVAASDIPNHELLVGGFPCQDYSVARTLQDAKGLEGRKGVLWWEIHRIVEAKKPNYLFLENVDRLLKSPAKHRGRDFGIMLASLSDLGYAVEWRVVNAADYGMPQRRRRVFILAYREETRLRRKMAESEPNDWVRFDGIFASAFPVQISTRPLMTFSINGQLDEISEAFEKAILSEQDVMSPRAGRFGSIDDHPSPFLNAGVMSERKVATIDVRPYYDGPRQNLEDIILTNGQVPLEYYLTGESFDRWAYLKGSKKENRTNKATGFEYQYSEGPLPFPDPLDRPARTVITGEGGPTPSRFKHVVKDRTGHLRRLTPIELERLNMFPDDHTAGVSDIRRAFFMGNALVVGIVERIGRELLAGTGAKSKKATK